MPTYASLLHNLQLMETTMKTEGSMVEISFLPHFHDMGLICSYLQVLYSGGTGYFMSPFTFVENPAIWIQAFSKYRGTHAKAPNFAFELVLRKGFPEDIDMNSVCYMLDGSEPVYMNTISRFESVLAPYGLRKNSVRAGYGLAEHTVFLCGAQEEDPVVINGRISCGRPILGVTVKIVDQETHTEVQDGEEGEIWVHSSSKTLGYWEKENETKEIFQATLDKEPEQTYLRTGDLGFVKDGHVFVSGRAKDLIIIHGRNIHPGDIELRVESLEDSLRPGRSAAFEYEYTSMEEDDSKVQIMQAIRSKGIGYVAELRSPNKHTPAELHSLAERIAATISLEFQVEVAMLAFISPRSMPRTTSGKRQRSLCKTKLIECTLSEIYRWSPFHENVSPNDSRPSTSNGAVDTGNTLSKLQTNQTSTQTSAETNQRGSLKNEHGSLETSLIHRSSEGVPHSTRPSEGSNNLQRLTSTMNQVLGVRLRPDSNIWAYGCNSFKAVQISQRLQKEFGFVVEPHFFYSHQTPLALLEKLKRSLLGAISPDGKQTQPTSHSRLKDEDIAIVGMACSFAGKWIVYMY